MQDKYAVVKIAGKQYLVREGEEIVTQKISEEKVDLQVLLFVNGDKVLIGKPLVKGKTVKVKVLEGDIKGKKVTIRKYKAKSRYRKKMGFRPRQTRLKIQKID